jgi:hypothetical protein
MADDHRRVIKLSDDRLAMGRDIAGQMLVGQCVIERVKRRYVGARRSKSSTVRRSENNLARSRGVCRGTSGMLLAWWAATDSIFAKSASSPPGASLWPAQAFAARHRRRILAGQDDAEHPGGETPHGAGKPPIAPWWHRGPSLERKR